jgi:hypothetical protein
MPPTIQALLAARIERLRPEERTRARARRGGRAPVLARGREELLPREIADFDRQLESLRRSELVEPDTGWFLGEPALRFHHVLIRDARLSPAAQEHAARSCTSASRTGSRAASARQRRTTRRSAGTSSRRNRHLRELGPLDAHGKALGERASRVLAEAVRRALRARRRAGRGEPASARALSALDAEDPRARRAGARLVRGAARRGRRRPRPRAIDELGRFAGDSRAPARVAHLLRRPARRAHRSAGAARDRRRGRAAAASSRARATPPARRRRTSCTRSRSRGSAGSALRGRARPRARRGARRAATAARQRGARGAPLAALWGPSPVTRASGRCLDVVRVLRITQGAPAVEAVALRCQACSRRCAAAATRRGA